LGLVLVDDNEIIVFHLVVISKDRARPTEVQVYNKVYQMSYRLTFFKPHLGRNHRFLLLFVKNQNEENHEDRIPIPLFCPHWSLRNFYRNVYEGTPDMEMTKADLIGQNLQLLRAHKEDSKK